MKHSEAGVLAVYRAFGLICSEVQPVYHPALDIPTQGELYCPVDNVVCVYTVKPFRLRSITNPLKEKIKFIVKSNAFLFAVCEQFIALFKQKDEAMHKLLKINCAVKLLLPCDDNVVAIISDNNRLTVYDVKNEESIVEMESPSSLNITTIVHPITYENQVVLGAEDGRMRIVDLERGKLIKEFPANDMFNCAITVLEQSPAVDVLAVGLANGKIHLRNIKLDRVFFSFSHEGSITSLSFRTDDVETMISGNSEGSIAVWDLNRRILVGQKTDAHKGPIVSLNFFLGEANFVSSGTDNRLVKWILKDENALPEEVKTLEGPSEPVTSISFVGSKSLLLSSKDGCVRYFRSFHHNNSLKRMGIAREVKKGDIGKNRYIDVPLNAIVEMEVGRAREPVWDNVLCRHENSPLVSTWSTRRATRGSHLLYHKRFQKNPKYLAAYATSVFLSSCGTFALIGYSSGHLDVFNMQSGRYCHSYGYKEGEDIEEDDQVAHQGAVTGLAMDMLNQTVVSGGADSSLHFWSFNPPKLISRVTNRACGSVALFRLNRLSSLLAVAFTGGDLLVVDVLCRRVARRFTQTLREDERFTALEFSADGRWLMSADSECMIKIWNISTATLIDVMRCSIPCIGISFSDNGEYIATIHEGERAAFIWANKALFASDFCAQTIQNESIVKVSISALPSLSAAESADVRDLITLDDTMDDPPTGRVVIIDDDDDEMDAEATPAADAEIHPARKQNAHLVTLSGQPPPRWANLPRMDLIRERNRPIEAPKKPENAPFFLPATETLGGFAFEKVDTMSTTADSIHTNGERVVEANGDMDGQRGGGDKENGIGSGSMLMAKRRMQMGLETSWTRMLNGAINEHDRLAAFDALKQMSVTAIDFQIRSLADDAFCQFLTMIRDVLVVGRDYELVQSYLATFLNVHREALWAPRDDNDLFIIDEDDQAKVNQKTEDERLSELLSDILRIHDTKWKEVQMLMNRNISLTQWIKSALL